MGYYDYTKEPKEKVWFEPEIWPDSDNWLKIDCGCMNGLLWDVMPYEECPRCRGMGRMALHIRTFSLCRIPGSPLIGRLKRAEAEKILARFIQLAKEAEQEGKKKWRKKT